MLREYWRTIALRALDDTKKQFGLESWLQIMIRLGFGIVAILALVFWGSEGAASDEFKVRIAIALLIVFAFPLLYFWNFISAPAKINQAKDAAIFRHVTRAIDTQNKTLIANTLTVLRQRGLDLMSEKITIDGFDSWDKRRKNWHVAGLNYIKNNISALVAGSFNIVITTNKDKFTGSVNDEHNQSQLQLREQIRILDNCLNDYKAFIGTMTQEQVTNIDPDCPDELLV